MSKFEEILTRIAYVAKLLIGVAGTVSVAVLGVSGIPVSWKLPLMLVAAVASAVGLYKTPNGPSVAEKKFDREVQAYLKSGGDVE